MRAKETLGTSVSSAIMRAHIYWVVIAGGAGGRLPLFPL